MYPPASASGFSLRGLCRENSRRHYNRPGPDILGRVEVCERRMPAGYTGEGRLIHSVPFVDTAAHCAFTRGVAGIDAQKRDTGAPGLVGQERSGLCEGPGVQAGSLTTASRYPGADMRQIFQRNAASGAFSGQHDHLRDAVVYVGAESPFLAGELAEATLGGLGATALQAGLAPCEPQANPLDVRAGVGSAVAVSGKVDNSKIDAEPLFRLELVGLWHVAGRGEIPLTANKTEIDFAFLESKQSALVFAHDDRNCDAAFDSPKADGIAAFDKPKYALVIRLSTIRTEARRNLAIDLESICYLGDRAHSCLSRQTKTVAQIMVGQLVKVKLTKYLGLKPHRRQPSRGFVAARKRRRQNNGLIWRRQKFYGCNEFHTFKYRGDLLSMQALSCYARVTIPPSAKAGGF